MSNNEEKGTIQENEQKNNLKDIERYKRDTNKEVERLNRDSFKKQIIALEEIEKLTAEEQEKFFEDIFRNIYEGKDIDSLKKYALRCIKLSCDPNNNKIHLPYGVIAQKKNDKLILKISNNRNILLFLILITLLFLAILGSSYSAITYSIVKNLNKDINGDGIPDINLTIDNDREAKINIDTNNDDKPDVNIDYKGNRKSVFNVDTDDDGKADFNLVNPFYRKDDKCSINCDVDGDGWPDINLDLDGDGKADIDIDTNGDKKADMNFDMNHDGVCDLHCDTNGDNICDEHCLEDSSSSKNDSQTKPQKDPQNTPNVTGTDSDVSMQSGDLTLEYEDGGDIFITDVYPDDQPYFENYIPTKKFKINNKSGLNIKYNLRWVVTLNNYESDNFMYKVASTNGGANLDWTVAPKATTPMVTEVIIPPYSTQEYSIDFKLKGVGGNQDYDQGKTFAGHVELYVDE